MSTIEQKAITSKWMEENGIWCADETRRLECVSVGSSQRCWWAAIDETTMGNAFIRSQHTFFHQSVAIMLIVPLLFWLFLFWQIFLPLPGFRISCCVPHPSHLRVISVISHIGCEKMIAIIELLCLRIWYFCANSFLSRRTNGE